MTAQIIPFPQKPVDEARLAMIGGHLIDAMPLPSRDAELQFLIEIADSMVGRIMDYEYVDSYLTRVEAFDALK